MVQLSDGGGWVTAGYCILQIGTNARLARVWAETSRVSPEIWGDPLGRTAGDEAGPVVVPAEPARQGREPQVGKPVEEVERQPGAIRHRPVPARKTVATGRPVSRNNRSRRRSRDHSQPSHGRPPCDAVNGC